LVSQGGREKGSKGKEEQIDGDLEVNKRVEQEGEDKEYVEVEEVEMRKLVERLEEYSREGYGIDANTYSAAYALLFHLRFPSSFSL